MTGRMHLGFYESDLNPPLGLPIGGYFETEARLVGFFDRLYAKAISIRTGSDRALLVSVDAVGLGLDVCDEIRDEIEKRLAVPRENIVIASTHTHAGPETLCWSVKWFERGDQDLVIANRNGLKASVIHAVTEAAKREQEVTSATFSSSRVHGLYANRNDPSRPIDNEISALMLRTSNATSVVLANYNNHPTILGSTNTYYSADFPGYVSRHVSEETGAQQVNCITGACGDVSAKPILGNEVSPSRNIHNAKRYGTVIGGTIVQSLSSGNTEDLDDFAVDCRTNRIRLEVKRVPTRDQAVRLAESIRAEIASDVDSTERIRLASALSGIEVWIRMMDFNGDRLPSALDADVGAIRIGDDGFLFLWVPGELFAGTGLKVKRASTAKLTMVSGYANGYAGYFASHEAFRNLEYEANFTPLGESSVDRLEESLLDLTH